MPLHHLLAGEISPMPIINPMITGLCADSRAVQSGDAFIALSGGNTHGMAHAMAANAANASAILFEPPVPETVTVPSNAIAVAGLRARVGRIANRFFDYPSHAMHVTGVTGTNGKTSTVQLIAQALSLHGDVAGSIGTLGAGLYGQLIAGERTTPDVIAVHQLMAQMRDAGAGHVAMEVSSHALEQGRVDDVAFKVAVFTNLTRDHLDYHGDMVSYGAAKAKLFSWPLLECVVINLDDSFGVQLLATVAPAVRRIGVSSRDHAEATLRAEQCRLSPAGLAFDLVEADQRIAVNSPLLGRFNIDNLMAVAGTLRALNWPLSVVAAMLPRLSPVAGRMSRAGGMAGQPLVVVDYAHTPDALEQALTSLREHTPGRLTCVFGCGGDRDRGKRAQMAAITERLADRIIVSDDNPRSEDGDAIVADILSGFSQRNVAEIERDRARAISVALVGTGVTDIVLIAGKGHETYQEIAGQRYPFDDLAIARSVLEQRL